jgi:hypothetical protein
MPILWYEILHLQQIKAPSLSYIKHSNIHRSKKHMSSFTGDVFVTLNLSLVLVRKNVP